MKKIAGEFGNSEQFKNDIILVTNQIAEAKNLHAASLSLHEYFTKCGVTLMSVKFCDCAEGGEVINPYSRYPDGVMSLFPKFQKVGGCPFSKEAKRRMQAFDSCTIDRKSYGSFLDRRFFQEIDKLEHKHIAIVPILIGSSVALFTVGLDNTPFKGELRQRITETIGHVVPAFINRFPDVKAIANRKYLSELERKVLMLLCQEFDKTEIVHEIGLSEFTIGHLIQNASHKMHAKNSQHLIYKAIALGEIPSPSSNYHMAQN